MQAVEQNTKQCLTCKEIKPIDQFRKAGGRGRGHRASECLSCYNRNSSLSCDSCPPATVEECHIRVALRLPVVCEDWWEDEWARIGMEPDEQQQYYEHTQDIIARYVSEMPSDTQRSEV